MVACLRHLAYVNAYDREDENLAISESVLVDSIKEFYWLIVKCFGKQYLLNHSPAIAEEKMRILERKKQKGFPELFALWDCKHYPWKNCSICWQGQYKGHAEGRKKIIMEAIADCNHYFWYINFGDPSSLNDVNVLNKSSIVGAMLQGKLDLKVPEYVINGTKRGWMYYLADGIYPDWAICVKMYSKTLDPNKAFFASC